MKKLTAILMAPTMILALAAPAQADVRYMSGPFRYGAWVPIELEQTNAPE